MEWLGIIFRNKPKEDEEEPVEFIAQAADDMGRFRPNFDDDDKISNNDKDPEIEFAHQASEDAGRFRRIAASEDIINDDNDFIPNVSDDIGQFRPGLEHFSDEDSIDSRFEIVQTTDDIGRFRPAPLGSEGTGHHRHPFRKPDVGELSAPKPEFIPQAADHMGRFRPNEEMLAPAPLPSEDYGGEDNLMDFIPQAADDMGVYKPNFEELEKPPRFIAQAADDVGRYRPPNPRILAQASDNTGRYRQNVLRENAEEKISSDGSEKETSPTPPIIEIPQIQKNSNTSTSSWFLSCCGLSKQDRFIDHDSMTADELGLLGVSVHCLMTKFMDSVNSTRGLDKYSKIYEIENLHKDMGVIRRQSADNTCPIDGKLGSAYVHTLKERDLVGPATLMLSYTWGYEIGQIIDTLNHYCTSNGLDTKRTYVWICCLCVNQHRVVENMKRKEDVPFDVFQATFHNRVTSIGHILAMMAPWTAPTYLDRAWCVFELFTANANGCAITIEMPSSERENFLDGITNGGIDDHVNKLFDTLSNTSVANAHASVEVDLKNILKLIKDGIGYKKFDIVINNLLRRWVIELIHDAVKSKSDALGDEECNHEHAKFLNQVGTLYANIGEYEAALGAFEPVLQFYERVNGSDHVNISAVLNNIALVYEHQGKFELALTNYKRVLSIDEKHRGEYHVDTALTLTNMAGALWRQLKYNEALKLLDRALLIQEEMLGDHINTANTLNSIGIILNRQEKYVEAFKIHNRVLRMKEDLLGKDHTSTANTLNNVGLVLKNQGKYKKALSHYKRALTIYEKVLGTEHPNTVRTEQNIELVLLQLKSGK